MSNLETVKRAAGALESRDLKELQALLSEDFKAKGQTLELTKQQALGYLHILFTAFPDHRFGFSNFEEKGELISCTGYEAGTHLGVLDLNPLGVPVSLPPTGKSFNMPKIGYTFRVEGDRVTYFGEEVVQGGGLTGILSQLGVKLPSS